jgi:nucleoside-diphosphate-sugar epimerase
MRGLQHHSAEKPQSVLVTGASGFIGMHVVRHLLLCGTPVIALVRTATSAERLQRAFSKSAITPSLLIITVDLHDRRAMTTAIQDIKPKACIHAAWDVHQPDYHNDAVNQRWVQSSIALFQALQHNDCSWMGVVGTCIEPAAGERASCRYAAAKSTLRHRLFELAMHDAMPVNVCWWRLFQPFGPEEPSHRFIPGMIQAFQRRDFFEVRNASAVRDFIHVDDVASAITASLKSNVTGVFDLGTGHGHRLGDVAQHIALRFNAIHLLHASQPTAHPTTFIADPQPLMSACNWRVKHNLHDALDEMLLHQAMSFKAVA